MKTTRHYLGILLIGILFLSCAPQQNQNRNAITYKASKEKIVATLIEVSSDIRPLFTFPTFNLQAQNGDNLQFQSGGSVFVNFTVVSISTDTTQVRVRGSAPGTGIISINIDDVIAQFIQALDARYARL
jgi:hypothetical protein